MKTPFIVVLAAASFPVQIFAAVDWAQPPVACVEEAVPSKPSKPCLDLTGVENPQRDFPAGMPDADKRWWQSQRRPLQYCRGAETLRREANRPGSASPTVVQIAWMQVSGADRSEEKIAAVYAASRASKIPVQVLTGALYQESMFASLGIASDGGNYSCGVGQVNTQEWCRWANTQSPAKKKAMNWPETEVDCAALPTSLVKPFYDIALTRLNGLPEYRLQKEHFSDIPFERVVRGFPSAPDATQRQRYRAVTSFISHCSDPLNGIAAKGAELATLYRYFVPAGLKKRDQYPQGQRFNRKCKDTGYEGSYPLNVGWLLAVGAYNAGPRSIDALVHYNRWSRTDIAKPETWIGFTPMRAVESLYWAGKYNPKTDRIDYKTLAGADTSWLWFKACIVQRHIARVVQHVTAVGAPVLADTLEGAFKCAKSVFDESGKLIRSNVPPHRQTSSGQKPQ